MSGAMKEQAPERQVNKNNPDGTSGRGVTEYQTMQVRKAARTTSAFRHANAVPGADEETDAGARCRKDSRQCSNASGQSK